MIPNEVIQFLLATIIIAAALYTTPYVIKKTGIQNYVDGRSVKVVMTVLTVVGAIIFWIMLYRLIYSFYAEVLQY